MCEKSCGCAQSCPRRFKGCACKTNDGRSVCFQDDRCVCFALWRECDPDLCGGCGVSDILAPGNRHDDTLLAGRCANAGLQRGRPRHTILGESSVHGLGLYACEDINAHEFVGEYRGEIITKQEAERRGVLQKILDLSYLFNINADQEVDATYMGNKTRFINHLKYGKANLVARIALVGTVHRIALFADKAIKAGDELFFDY
ncbi:SET domain-containing protein, partial [Polychaeton citri CBS 116435]